MCDSGVVGNARPCQGRDRGFEPRLSLTGNLVFTRFFYYHIENSFESYMKINMRTRWKEDAMGKKLLIIEDDLDLREGLHFSFAGDGYDVVVTGTKKQGIKEIQKGIYEIVLLDCNLPDGTGFELCKEVRKFSTVPMVMLTARDTEMDEIKALELGVDDYLSKPFSLGVLKARMKRILNDKIENAKIVSADILIDKNSCKVYKRKEEVSLSKLEYKLLMYLMENKNHVLSKEQILSHIWDCDGKYVDHNTLSVNISRLRTKIEDDASLPQNIKTVHGIGYIWKGD